jgi:hypothetical protein
MSTPCCNAKLRNEEAQRARALLLVPGIPRGLLMGRTPSWPLGVSPFVPGKGWQACRGASSDCVGPNRPNTTIESAVRPPLFRVEHNRRLLLSFWMALTIVSPVCAAMAQEPATYAAARKPYLEIWRASLATRASCYQQPRRIGSRRPVRHARVARNGLGLPVKHRMKSSLCAALRSIFFRRLIQSTANGGLRQPT